MFQEVSKRYPNTKNRLIELLVAARGVQYVHWVMHKCIMVKEGETKYTERGREQEGGKVFYADCRVSLFFTNCMRILCFNLNRRRHCKTTKDDDYENSFLVSSSPLLG